MSTAAADRDIGVRRLHQLVAEMANLFTHFPNRKPFHFGGKLLAWLRRSSPDVYKLRDTSLPASKPVAPEMEWSPSSVNLV